MTEEIEFILDSTKESMAGSIAHLEKEFLNIRAGKASPAMLEVFCRLLSATRHFLRYQN
jgi:ribosome recycling factor